MTYVPFNSETLALDFETTPEGEVVGVSLSDKNRTEYMPVMLLESLKPLTWVRIINDDVWKRWLDKSLRNCKYLVAHNATFELNVLSHYDIDFSNLIVMDTMAMAHLYNESSPLGLKELSYLVLDRRQKSFSFEHFLSLDSAIQYGSADSRNTFDLGAWYWEQLEKEDLLDLFWDEVLPLTLLSFRMSQNGIKLNYSALESDSELLKQLLAEYQAQLISMFDCNINSSAQIVSAFESLGVKWKREWITSKGNKSARRSILDEIAEDYRGKPAGKFAETLINYRKAEKVLQFIEGGRKGVGLLKLADQNGYVHPTWKPYGTATGRWSCSEPNLQNQPRPMVVDGHEINPRRWFCADAGNLFVLADLSAAEYKVLGGISRDPKMEKAFREGLDIHQFAAHLVFNVPYDQVTPEQRQFGKLLNFAIIYGAGDYSLAEKLGVSVAVVRDARARLRKAFPQATRWTKRIVRQAERTGVVYTYFGRPRRPVYLKIHKLWNKNIDDLPSGPKRIELASLHSELRKDKLTIDFIKSQNRRECERTLKTLYMRGQRQARNAVIQGTVAQIINRALLKLDELGYRVVMQVHDEIVIEVPESKAQETIGVLEKVMVQKVGNVSIEGEAAYGKDWYSAK